MCLLYESTLSYSQIIKMNNERITVPEILFRPSDISIEQIGLAESVNHVISSTDSGITSPRILINGDTCGFLV